MLCEYGCSQEAKYQFKNGKWCCCDNFNHCIGYRKKLSFLRKGKISPHKGKRRDYSQEARYKMGSSTRGKLVWNSGLKNCFNEATLEKMRKKRPNCNSWNKGKTYKLNLTEEGRKKLRDKMLNGGAKKANENNFRGPCKPETKEKISKAKIGFKHSEKFKECRRQKMLNGQALKMIKAIKKISNEEIKLRNMVKEFYPNCEFQYPVLRYSLDVAIPEHKIAIEYDGYYHFCSEENKQYHKQRQEKIESEGWKFYRVTMFDKFPTVEEVKEQINKRINSNNG